MKRRGYVFSVFVTALLTVTLAACGSGSTTKGSHATATGQADVQYFAGKTISLYPTALGSTSDLAMRKLVPYLESYLHATVNVINIPGAGSASTNLVASSAPNGLSISLTNVVTTIDSNYLKTDTQDFSMQKVDWIAALGLMNYLFVSCPGSPYKTWSEVLAAKKPVTIVDYNQGAGIIPMYLLLQASHVPTKEILGYTSSTQVPGCLRGDGDITPASASLTLNASLNGLDSGLVPLLLGRDQPKQASSAFLNHTPTIEQYYAEHPPTSAAARQEVKIAEDLLPASGGAGLAVMTAYHTPPKILAALTAAFKYAMNRASVQQAFINLTLPPGFVNPDVVIPQVKLGAAETSTVLRYLKRPTQAGP